MMIGMVVFWAVVIVAVVWLARGLFNGSRVEGQTPGEDRQTPLEILERRFAQGSVSDEDYRERREVLTGRAAGQSSRQPGRQ